MAKAELELKKQPSYLTGYLKGLASRLGGDDEPILLSAAAYIEKVSVVSEFSEFIRNATPEKKAEVFGRVMDEASAEQRKLVRRCPHTGNKCQHDCEGDECWSELNGA